MLSSSAHHADTFGRRQFLKSLTVGGAGLALGSLAGQRESSAKLYNPENSKVSFVAGKDRREMVSAALKPFEKEVGKAINGKKVSSRQTLDDNT